MPAGMAVPTKSKMGLKAKAPALPQRSAVAANVSFQKPEYRQAEQQRVTVNFNLMDGTPNLALLLFLKVDEEAGTLRFSKQIGQPVAECKKVIPFRDLIGLTMKDKNKISLAVKGMPAITLEPCDAFVRAPPIHPHASLSHRTQSHLARRVCVPSREHVP